MNVFCAHKVSLRSSKSGILKKSLVVYISGCMSSLFCSEYISVDMGQLCINRRQRRMVSFL